MTRHLFSASIVLLATGSGLAGQNAVPAAAGAPAKPERRVALIIGNSSYPRAQLRNPVQDARAMKTAVEGLGFKATMLLDADKKTMEQAIAEFGADIHPGDIALFYYAGHGVQVKDLSDQEANYLVPAGFDGKDETDVKYGAVHAGIVLDRMERAKSRLNLLVLDACRDNPFRSLRTRGLAAMDAPGGSYIAFATGPGKQADDNPDGRNGLFTGQLVTVLSEPKPGATLDDVFNEVRARVLEISKNQQRPWSVTGAATWLPWGKKVEPERPRPIPVVATPEFQKAAQEAIENGSKLLIAGDYKEAVTRLDGAVRNDPNNALAFLSRGLAHGLLRERESEIQDYDEAIRLEPRNFIGYLNRALARKRAGQCSAAMADFDRTTELAPGYEPAYRYRGACLLSLERFEAADRELAKALSLDPKDAEALASMGSVRLKEGKYDLAARSFDEAIRVNPESARALLGRAEAREKLGDRAGAEQSRQKARGLLPRAK